MEINRMCGCRAYIGMDVDAERYRAYRVLGNGASFFILPGVDGLVVVDIKSCSELQKWNVEHPQEAVRRGHVVLEVNSQTGLQQMVDLLRTGIKNQSDWLEFREQQVPKVTYLGRVHVFVIGHTRT